MLRQVRHPVVKKGRHIFEQQQPGLAKAFSRRLNAVFSLLFFQGDITSLLSLPPPTSSFATVNRCAKMESYQKVTLLLCAIVAQLHHLQFSLFAVVFLVQQYVVAIQKKSVRIFFAFESESFLIYLVWKMTQVSS